MNRLTISLVLLASVAFMAGIGTGKLTSPSPVYRDVEGNVIPSYAVDSLVLDQFAHISTAGRDTLNKYFYFQKDSLERRFLKAWDSVKLGG